VKGKPGEGADAGTIAPRQGEQIDEGALAACLNRHFGDVVNRLYIRQFPAGHSNLTYLIRRGARDYVLRRPPFGYKAHSAHDMRREYRVLRALKGHFPFSPEALFYCEDAGVIGAEFYLMERLEGAILHRTLPEGVTLDAKQARRLCHNAVDVLVALHGTDLQANGLADLGKIDGYVARQVTGWSRRFRDARTPDVPDGEIVMQWLVQQMPVECTVGCLIHNDYKFDNLVLSAQDPTRIVGVLDWEMATIGDPLMDLGCSLAYWVEANDPEDLQRIRMLPTHLPGMLSRRQVLRAYLDAAGIHCENFAFYRVFGLFRLAVIVQQIYYRYAKGQTRDTRFRDFGNFARILLRVARRHMENSTE